MLMNLLFLFFIFKGYRSGSLCGGLFRSRERPLSPLVRKSNFLSYYSLNLSLIVSQQWIAVNAVVSQGKYYILAVVFLRTLVNTDSSCITESPNLEPMRFSYNCNLHLQYKRSPEYFPLASSCLQQSIYSGGQNSSGHCGKTFQIIVT